MAQSEIAASLSSMGGQPGATGSSIGAIPLDGAILNQILPHSPTLERGLFGGTINPVMEGVHNAKILDLFNAPMTDGVLNGGFGDIIAKIAEGFKAPATKGTGDQMYAMQHISTGQDVTPIGPAGRGGSAVMEV